MADGEQEQTPRDLYEAADDSLVRMGDRLSDMLRDGRDDVLRKVSGIISATELVIESIDVPPVPTKEFGLEQPDGTVAYVRLWDNAYEIAGKKTRLDKSVGDQDLFSVLDFLMDNPGRAFVLADIASSIDRLDRLAPQTRVTVVGGVARFLHHQAKGTGLITSSVVGTNGHKEFRWCGLGIPDDVLEDKTKLLRSMAGRPTVTYQPSKISPGRSLATSVATIYEKGYEIEGNVQLARTRLEQQSRSLLQTLILNRGRMLTLRDLRADNPELSAPQVYEAISYLRKISGRDGVIQAGKAGNNANWYGIGISNEIIVEQLKNLRAKPEAAEPASVEPPKVEEATSQMPWPEGSLLDHFYNNNPDLEEGADIDEPGVTEVQHTQEEDEPELAADLAQEYKVKLQDGTEVYLRVWDTGYDINGEVINGRDMRKSTHRDSHAVLSLLMNHIGEKLSMDQILGDTDFLGFLSSGSRRNYFNNGFRSLNFRTGNSGILQTGTIGDGTNRRWYGLGIGGNFMVSGEDDSFDFTILRSLATNGVEAELLEYVIRRCAQPIDVIDLVREATSLSIPGDKYERKIFPALQKRAEELEMPITFTFNSVIVGGEKRKFLEISHKAVEVM